MTPNEEVLRRALAAFHRGYAGKPGTVSPRQIGKTAAGVQAVLDHMGALAADERTAFEVFLKDYGRSSARDTDTGKYVSFGADLAWEAWQSSAAQLRLAAAPAHSTTEVPEEYVVIYKYWDGWPLHAACNTGNQNGPLLARRDQMQKTTCFKCRMPMLDVDSVPPVEPPADGVSQIQAERERQRTGKGFTAGDERVFKNDELVRAAVGYALYESRFHRLGLVYCSMWPWHLDWWKPCDPLTNLVRAGALIAAEIDRHIALGGIQ